MNKIVNCQKKLKIDYGLSVCYH